jgi:hypothetical protein
MCGEQKKANFGRFYALKTKLTPIRSYVKFLFDRGKIGSLNEITSIRGDVREMRE